MTVRAIDRKILWDHAPLPVCNVYGAIERVSLPARERLLLRGDHRWKLIVCRSGSLWITQTDDSVDYLLKAGESMLVTQAGLVIIQANKDATLELTSALHAAA